jgi:lipoprotein-anchoring transpeptidase ErfK/SrfK
MRDRPPPAYEPSGRTGLGWLALAFAAAAGCHHGAAAGADDAGAVSDAAPAATQGLNSVAPPPAPPDKPLLGVTAFVATVYKEPRDTSRKLGYLRVGAKVARSAEPAGKANCPGGWYEIYPRGFVCAGEDATTNLDDPILKAASRRPDTTAPLPYKYAFVRAVLPFYLRVPTKEEQLKSEFKLQEHLDWFKDNQGQVSQVVLGADDVPIDERGVPLPDKKVGELGQRKNSQEIGIGALLGGDGDGDSIPSWLQGGKRLIPNIADFKVPEYAVFADRARRHTGLSLVGSFLGGPESLDRRFAVTTDLRLVPATKIKPDTGSAWHGLELHDEMTLPLAFVRSQGARSFKIMHGKVVPAEEVEHRGAHALTGKMRTVEGVKYYRTKEKRWLSQMDVGLAVAPAPWPDEAQKGQKWIEISITNQTLVLWEGKNPVYATLVSTGQAGLDDPKKTTATIRGVFHIRNKHISAMMDSNESSAVGGHANSTAAVVAVARDDDDKGAASDKAKGKAGAKGAAKGDKGGEKKGGDTAGGAKEKGPAIHRGDGVYGVTRRRGEGTFQLRDVPYIQYFESGYALHAAYWHDVFGTPRSHGCVNLAPVDAHRVFNWTDPPVPEGWHGINTGDDMGEGTTVIIHE